MTKHRMDLLQDFDKDKVWNTITDASHALDMVSAAITEDKMGYLKLRANKLDETDLMNIRNAQATLDDLWLAVINFQGWME